MVFPAGCPALAIIVPRLRLHGDGRSDAECRKYPHIAVDYPLDGTARAGRGAIQLSRFRSKRLVAYSCLNPT